MADVTLRFYQYTVVGNKITAVNGITLLTVNDKDGNGLVNTTELAAALGVKPGQIRGSNPAGPENAAFSVGENKDFTLYSTNGSLAVGATVNKLAPSFPAINPLTDDVPCFAADTLIDTARGLVAAGDLVAGDMVRTRDAGFQPVRWTGQRSFAAADLAAAPNLRPIRITAGALGANIPATDLVVSPQHRVLVRSAIAQKMFSAPEVLVAAKQLLQIDGIDVAEDLAQVTYVHFLFDDHQIVFSNGAETESLHTGVEALKSVGTAARAEIFAIFPELRDGSTERAGARMLTSGRMGRRLAVRHAENRKALVS